MKIIKNNLKNLRNEHNVTAEALAKILGCNSNQVSVWENNILQPRHAYVYQMLDYFKCDYKDLFYLEG